MLAFLPYLVSVAGITHPICQLNLKVTESSRAQAIALSRSLGSVTPRAGGFVLTLNHDSSYATAKSILSQARGVEIEPLSPKLAPGVTSLKRVSELARCIDGYRLALKDFKEVNGDPGEGGEEDEGLDFLGALHQYTAQRAFPNDSVDWDAWRRAALHRDAMPSGHIGKGIQQDSPSSNWQFIGPKNMDVPYRIYYGLSPVNGRVNGIAVDPTNSNVIYAAGAGGGVLKSTDGGTTWSALGDGWSHLQASCVKIDPTNHNTIYVGTGDFHGFGSYCPGVMKSTDGGATWTALGASTFGNFAISDILIDPENPQILVASSGRGNNYWSFLYRSTNGGTTWSPVISTYAAWGDLDMSIKVGSSRYYYAVGGDYGGQVWRSADRGATWTKLSPPISSGFHDSLGIACSTNDINTVYLLAPVDSEVLKSTDHGGSWSNTTGNLATGYNMSQGWYDWHITVADNGANDMVYVGLIDVSVSENGNSTWTSLGGPTYSNSATIHNDQHCMAVDPSNPNVVYEGCDGGMYRITYTPANHTWANVRLSANLQFTQFYSLATHPTSNILIGGTQDNATPLLNNDLTHWRNVGGGDGGGTAIIPTVPGTQYTCSQYIGQDGSGNIGVYKTTNIWGATTFPTTNASGDRILFIAPMASDPTANNMYVGTNYLYRYNGSSWANRLGGQVLSVSGSVSAIAVSKVSGQKLYTGSDQGEVWASSNAGATWRAISAGAPSLPNRYVTSISPNPFSLDDVLVGLSGTGGGHLYRCSDTTAGTISWSNVSGSGGTGLPDTPLNGIARDPDSPNTTWYVAMDNGVYMTSNSGATWTNITQPLGLPNVQCNAITAEPGTRWLTVATFGRGVWRVGLPATLVPITYTITQGSPFSGNVASLQANDGNYLQYFNDGTSLEGEVVVEFPSPIPTASKLDFTMRALETRGGLAGRIDFFNFTTSTYENVDGFEAGTAPFDRVTSISTSAATYVNASTKRVRVRINVAPINDEVPSQDSWLLKIDSTILTVSP